MKYYGGALTWQTLCEMPFPLMAALYDEMHWQSKEEEKQLRKIK